MKSKVCKKCQQVIRLVRNLDGKLVFIAHYDLNGNVCKNSDK